MMDWLVWIVVLILLVVGYRWLGSVVIRALLVATPRIIWDQKDYRKHVWLWPIVLLVTMLFGGAGGPGPDGPDG